ncbi:hypothetical protein [Delftia tsuruhatensis]|uniref:hypothetical protein n=1 Tax=Delftia tsuruhatensis TaxID=180282 RepID=UPI000FF88D39|nr:hypothetical protein [Delftia tsuruhatensis]
MPIPNYTPEYRRSLAQKLGIDEQYLYQIVRGLRVASPALARSLNAEDPQARLQDLRPDDWHLIWPELAPLASPPKENSHA